MSMLYFLIMPLFFHSIFVQLTGCSQALREYHQQNLLETILFPHPQLTSHQRIRQRELFLQRSHEKRILTSCLPAGVKKHLLGYCIAQEVPVQPHAIHQAVLTADGNTIISCSDDGSVFIWKQTRNTNNFYSYQTIIQPDQVDTYPSANHPWAVVPRSVLALSPDEELFVIGRQNGELLFYTYQNEGDYFYHYQTISCLQETITSLTFSDDSTLLAVGGKRGNCLILKKNNAKDFYLYQELLAPSSNNTSFYESEEVVTMKFSYDTALLAIGYYETIKIDLWHKDTLTQEFKRIMPIRDGPPEIISQLLFSPDNKKLIGGYRNGYLRIWSIIDNFFSLPYAKLEGHTGKITSLAFLDSRYFFSQESNGDFKFWDYHSIKSLSEVADFQKPIILSYQDVCLYTPQKILSVYDNRLTVSERCWNKDTDEIAALAASEYSIE